MTPAEVREAFRLLDKRAEIVSCDDVPTENRMRSNFNDTINANIGTAVTRDELDEAKARAAATVMAYLRELLENTERRLTELGIELPSKEQSDD